jgi:bifunctional pyridoxal-dependent enzyme with beta-cystathionase and maltose regulon repressor activities
VTPEQIVGKWIEKNAGVQLGAGSGFGKGGENHMRMNIATSRKTLEKALASIGNALKTKTTMTAAL